MLNYFSILGVNHIFLKHLSLFNYILYQFISKYFILILNHYAIIKMIIIDISFYSNKIEYQIFNILYKYKRIKNKF